MTIGSPVKRHLNGISLGVDSDTILRAYWEVGGHWANQASIQSRATIGPPVKICSLVEINMTNIGQMIDGLSCL